MERDEPKTPSKPSYIAEQLKELLQLRRKVRAAEIAAASCQGHRPGNPTAGGPEHSAKTPSESGRKFRG